MTATVVVGKPEVLADEPVAFSISGCAPGELVTVTASWLLGEEEVSSEGRFEAPPTGIVEPGRLPSLGGSYTGIEPHGLWWSVEPEDPRAATKTLGPWSVSITAAGAAWETSGTLVRTKIAGSVQRIDVASGALRGIAFVPSGPGPFAAVLLVSGSAGGITSVQNSAALLASRGFATLALAYFNYPDLPAELIDIPLEYFQAGLRWLTENLPTTGRPAVMGESRGGELSLLLGSAFPDQVAAVVAMVPSGVVWGGVGRDSSGPPTAAWTRDGVSVPALGSAAADEKDPPYRGDAVVYTPSFEAALAAASPAERAAAEIPVERCGGPVLLLSGEDDALWPSTALAEIAVQRGRANGARFPIRHLSYPDAGHMFTRPAGFPAPLSAVHPIMGENIAYGGSVAGNAHASADSWPKIIDFLRDSLPASGSQP